MKIKKVLLFIMMLFTFSFAGCFDKECEVSFIVDGEEIHEVEVIKGEKVEAPENPTKNGYTFVGWYNGKTKFDFKKEVKSDVELTAKFEVINYTITLDLDGGAIEGSTSFTYNVEQTVTLKDPTKANLAFVGWQEEGSSNVVRTVTLEKGTTGDKHYKAIYANVEQVFLYIDNLSYKILDVPSNGKVLDYVDDLSETTIGWFKDYILHESVTEEDFIQPGMTLYTKSVYQGGASFSFCDENNEAELCVYTGYSWNGVIPRKVNGKLVREIRIIGGYSYYSYDVTLPSSSIKLTMDTETRLYIKVFPKTLKQVNGVVINVTGATSIEIAKSNPIIPLGSFVRMLLTRVTFEKNSILETIGAHAFAFTSLETITIPNSVKTIGEYAFGYVDTLTSVEFEENSQLEEIGEGAFTYTNLETITIPSSVKTIGDSAFYNQNELTSVEFEKNSILETIGSHAFAFTSLETITIPNSVKTIGEYAFGFVYTLTSVEFEENAQLQTIGKCAFDSTSLETITIPTSVTSIGGVSVAVRASDNAIIILKENIEIGEGAFNYLPITKVIFEENSQLETIGERAFQGTKLTTITIPSSVKTIGGVSVAVRASDNAIIILKENIEIGESAFRGMPIEKILFEENSQLETIGERAFQGTKLTIITIPNSVKTIGEYAFGYVDTLTSVEFEANSQLETIGNYAFYGTKITTITIPSSVKTIGDDAFSINTLTSVEFEANSQLETIGDDAFYETKLETITIPSSVKTIGGVSVKVRASDNAIIILNGNNEIGERAFSYLPITKVIFEENSQLETIGDYAFRYTKLETITIPSSVKKIEDLAFYDVETLISVEFEENSQLETIGDYAFAYTSLETITIPASVKTIGDYAFYNQNELTSVEFEENAQLETIGVFAFDVETIVTINSQTVYELIEENILDVNEIYVLKTLTGTNSYLEDNYNKTESGDYWVYTKKAN